MNVLWIGLGILLGPSTAVLLFIACFEIYRIVWKPIRNKKNTGNVSKIDFKKEFKRDYLSDARIFAAMEEILHEFSGLDAENREASLEQLSDHPNGSRGRRSTSDGISNG